MKPKLKPIPKFKSEKAERKFWETQQAISIRLPASLLERIKIEANKRDVPYQSLIKIWLAEKVG